VRGVELKPLHDIAIAAAAGDARLARRLALVDTLRAGDVRLRGLAESLLVDEVRAA